MVTYVLIVAAAMWGYHRGVRMNGATRGRVVLLAAIASAAVATVAVIFSAGSVGAELGGAILASEGYWIIAYAFVVGAVVALLGLAARGMGGWMGGDP
ncbi:MAG: hypothetical protein IT359_16210 [Gemmatimonadaceae bacterium]|nr:hypothetical protein [Gemmatimonadaceae bacterium]